MVNKNYLCKGCRTHNESMIEGQLSLCHLRPHAHTNHNCPCPQCIIKPICNDPCTEFFKYAKILTKFMEKFG